MSLTIKSGNQVKQTIQQPVKNKQQFDLLAEMNFLMPKKAWLILFERAYPDEDEKRKSRIVFKDAVFRVNDPREHTQSNIIKVASVPAARDVFMKIVEKNDTRKIPKKEKEFLNERRFA